MASRRRCLQLAQQHALARAFSVRSSQLAATLEALASPPAATAKAGGAKVWFTLGLGFATAGLAIVPTKAACAPAMATEVPVRPLAAVAVQQLSLKSASTGNAKLAAVQPINLAGAPLPTPKLDYQIVFVLGGPGSGKGTQCAKLVEEFGLVHLSAGDLLRAHMKSGTEDGNMVANMIKNGQIVPSRVTISLLEKAMRDSGKRKFLIDGFPRNEENRSNFESQTGIEPAFVLYFDCPEQVMERRLLGRQEGRTDDNLETIRKRFKVFMDSTLPIITFYEAKGRVRRINADRSPQDVYADVRKLFCNMNSA